VLTKGAPLLVHFLLMAKVNVYNQHALRVCVCVCVCVYFPLSIWTNGLTFMKFNNGVRHNIQFILIDKNNRHKARIWEAEEILQAIGYCISY
jgi:hypothetical protein